MTGTAPDLPRWLRPAGLVADLVAGAALAAMLAVVAGSILARLAFDLSGGAVNLLLPGAIELARYALMIMVFAALPRAVVAGLVRVDLIIERLPPRLADALSRLCLVLAAAVGGVIAWRLGAAALLQAGRGDATQDLALPLWPFFAAGAGFAGLMALTALAGAMARRPRD